MARYDLKNKVAASQSIVPTAVGSNTTTTGTGIDVGQANEVIAVFEVGSRTDGTYTPSLEESAVVGSGYAAVAAGDMVGSFAAATAAGIQTVGYIGSKQFIRVVDVSTSVTTGAVIAAQIIASGRRKQP